jgi:nucleotide-binding universal stress UspA family protein
VLGNLDEIKNILVPVDYSETSKLACRYALMIGYKANANIVIFHAFHSPAYDLIELTGNKSTQNKLWNEVTAKLTQVEEKKAESFLQELLKAAELDISSLSPISKIIRPGLAKDEIQKFAKEFKPDLIIMGSKGKNENKNTVLGSTADIALKKFKYPILLIPENFDVKDNHNNKNLLFLTEYDESDFMSIIEILNFARLMNLSIYCVHVGSKVGKWEKLKMSGLEEYFTNAYKDVHLKCDILTYEKDLLRAVDNFIKNNSIRILSLTMRKRNLLERIIKANQEYQLSYQTSKALLVFHS